MLGLNLLDTGLKLIDKFIPDPLEKIKAENELRKDLFDMDKEQLKVNAVEAGHRSIWVAGWRPAIGWTCASAFFMHYVAIPLLQTIAVYADFTPPVLSFDMQSLLTVMMGMLGMGGLRTYEKMKGLTK